MWINTYSDPFFVWKVLYLIEIYITEIYSHGFVGLFNNKPALVKNVRPAIFSTKDAPGYRCIHLSLGLDELEITKTKTEEMIESLWLSY